MTFAGVSHQDLLKKYAAQFREAVPLVYYGYGGRLQPWLCLVKP